MGRDKRRVLSEDEELQPSLQSLPMTDQAMSPLRRRMIEDMTIRKFAPKTQHDYLQKVKNFTTYLGRSPDTASSEDVRRYQLQRRCTRELHP